MWHDSAVDAPHKVPAGERIRAARSAAAAKAAENLSSHLGMEPTSSDVDANAHDQDHGPAETALEVNGYKKN